MSEDYSKYNIETLLSHIFDSRFVVKVWYEEKAKDSSTYHILIECVDESVNKDNFSPSNYRSKIHDAFNEFPGQHQIQLL